MNNQVINGTIMEKLNCIIINNNKICIRRRYKNIINILKNIKNYSDLVSLYINDNNINFIPNNIKYLVKLKQLSFNFNKLFKLPKCIKYMTNISMLNLSNNNFRIFPKEITYLSNLINLDLGRNNLKLIPKEINSLMDLKILLLNHNIIEIIPEELFNLTNLNVLNISNNKIKILSNSIGILTNLKLFNISNNQINIIPNSIIYCIFLQQFYYQNNTIENISPIITRYLNRMHNLDMLQVYNDAQNIHNHSIQESLFDSIVNIINQNYIINNDEIINNIIQDTILTEKTKNLLIEYCENKDVHSKTQLTFEELLFNVWTLINTLDTKDEIKNILNTEMHDSECKCFTGRISRLVNCLNGFTDLVKITISDNQQIGNIIILIKEKLESENNYSIEKHKELVIKELIERDFSKETIDGWINYII